MLIRFGCVLLALGLLGGPARAIVGGAEDKGALAQSTVMVLSSKGGVCSAVVVDRDVVLTAAHCVTGADAFRVHYRDESGEPVLITPAARAVHPGYDARAVEKRRRSIDLALLRVPSPLPGRFLDAALSASAPAKAAEILVGGYGLAREGDPRSTGTFRTAPLRVVEPFGPSQILLWAEGHAGTGACQGDSGGPLALGSSVVAITTWSRGSGQSRCGSLTQGALLGPQRDWLDRTLQQWGRAARWE